MVWYIIKNEVKLKCYSGLYIQKNLNVIPIYSTQSNKNKEQ